MSEDEFYPYEIVENELNDGYYQFTVNEELPSGKYFIVVVQVHVPHKQHVLAWVVSSSLERQYSHKATNSSSEIRRESARARRMARAILLGWVRTAACPNLHVGLGLGSQG
jgi:hypothetical protein